MPAPDPAVDTRLEGFVSFPPSVAPAAADTPAAHPRVPVGPGRSAIAAPSLVSRGHRPEVSGYPVQLAKVQPPPLRDETLARDRLLDWLQAKIHHRVVYVTAEAGYGKTTLLADFSRRTRLRTLWYRLDEEDRNWVAFLSYLVAAGREHDTAFAGATSGLLREVAGGGVALDVALETFVRDLQALAEQGAIVVIDDYHVVDDSPEIRQIMRELFARAPERVTFAIASRRTPSLPVARLRAQGEVAELLTDDLRFSESETERLFRETYGRPLEPDVLNDLSRRTEGWAASLQLVQAAIRGRSAGEVRSFVRSLSGAEGDLYDYLAEEVIGNLPDDLQAYLMQISLLESLDQELVAAVSGLDGQIARSLTAAAERAGLIARRAPFRGGVGFHPLVRQFLQDRLRREVGVDGVRKLHLAAADAASDWAVACHHLSEAHVPEALHHRLSAAIKDVLGGGRFQIAEQFLDRHRPDEWTSPLEMIRSRAALRAGRPSLALKHAEAAYLHAKDSDLAGLNYASLLFMTGNLRLGLDVARKVPRDALDPVTAEIADSMEDIVALSGSGDIGAFADRAVSMATRQAAVGLRHYEGISRLNAAICRRSQGQAAECLDLASRAADLLKEGGASYEAVSAQLARSWALAHLGRWSEALVELSSIQSPLDQEMQAEVLGEAAAIHIWYGDDGEAARLISSALELKVGDAATDIARLTAAELAIRQQRYDRAADLLAEITQEPNREPGFAAHHAAVAALLAFLRADADAGAQVAAATVKARQRGASFWLTHAALVEAVAATDGRRFALPDGVRSDSAYLSVLAELIVSNLHRLEDADLAVVHREADGRKHRWRDALRATAADPRSQSRWHAARLLDSVGEGADIPFLRAAARSARAGSPDRSLGRQLARRLAPRVWVEDQGRVRLHIGEQQVDGSAIRRRVLGMLCFLLARPGFAATRDEVLDALWPELEPDVAINSVNQTVYFLRRVFEPEYHESTSPGYLRFDSSVLWLDEELVASRSALCLRLVNTIHGTSQPADVVQLSQAYRGRFALDFAYDEWAIPFRETLHAAYLQVIEAAVSADTASGHFERGISLARAALEVDPSAESLETSLVRLYRLSGAHAAAAEQYEHYAASMRQELGIEPPALEAL